MLILPTASEILFNAVIPGGAASGSRLDIAYLEFVNGPAVVPPEINPPESAAWYQGLGSTPDRDYLRCPVFSHKRDTDPDGKPILYVAVASEGGAGVHGKPFSSGSLSRVYGVALAASQTGGQPDLLFARHYYPPAEQIEKPDHGGIMVRLGVVLI
jgi:hypothetical protein